MSFQRFFRQEFNQVSTDVYLPDCFGFGFAFLLAVAAPVFPQDRSEWLTNLPKEKDYVQKRASSYDRSGGNFDLRHLPAGETLTLLEDSGPGIITHIWITLTSDSPDNLKALVLRVYWPRQDVLAGRWTPPPLRPVT